MQDFWRLFYTETLRFNNFYIIDSTNSRKTRITITQAPVNVYVNDIAIEYGETIPNFSVHYSGLKNDESTINLIENFTYETTASKTSDVGDYDIVASGGSCTNYAFINYEKGKLSITKAPLLVMADNASRFYYSDNPEFKCHYTGFKHEDNESCFIAQPSVMSEATKSSEVGTYTLTPYGGIIKNYVLTYRTGLLTITQRPLEIIANNKTKIYGENNPDFSLVYAGFVNNENESVLENKPSIKCSATKYSDVGNYDIIPYGGFAKNYSMEYKNGVLSISKASQTIFWEQDFPQLNVGDQIELTANASSGLKIEYEINNSSIANVYSVGSSQYLDCLKEGTLVIKAYQPGNRNYDASKKVPKTIMIVDPNFISDVQSEINTEMIYDLQGRKIIVPSKGMYIINGKKILYR